MFSSYFLVISRFLTCFHNFFGIDSNTDPSHRYWLTTFATFPVPVAGGNGAIVGHHIWRKLCLGHLIGHQEGQLPFLEWRGQAARKPFRSFRQIPWKPGSVCLGKIGYDGLPPANPMKTCDLPKWIPFFLESLQKQYSMSYGREALHLGDAQQ